MFKASNSIQNHFYIQCLKLAIFWRIFRGKRHCCMVFDELTGKKLHRQAKKLTQLCFGFMSFPLVFNSV